MTLQQQIRWPAAYTLAAAVGLIAPGCIEYIDDEFGEPVFLREQAENFGYRVREPAGTDAKYVAVGVSRKRTSCAVTDAGEVDCWGRTGNGVPKEQFVQVDGGDSFMCGVTVAGTIECWVTSPETLGDDVSIQVPPGAGYSQVTAGFGHVCGFRQTTGDVECVSALKGEPDPVVDGVPKARFTSFWSGYFDACGVHPDGTVECWGEDLGSGGAATPPGRYKDVAVGGGNACAIRQSDGHVICWGSNAPKPDPTGDYGFTKVSVSADGACGLTEFQTLDCWGNADFVNAPVDCFLDVAVAEFHACAVSQHHDVVCWGDAESVQASTPSNNLPLPE